MRKPFIAGNWKMNKVVEQATSYADTLTELVKKEGIDHDKVDIAICAPYLYLSALKVIFLLRGIDVGAQNLHYEDEGAYTGEISAKMLHDLRVECCIIGHSERRKYNGETSAECAKKVKAAIMYDIRPILCVGETLEERESGNHLEVVKNMLLESLHNVTGAEMVRTVIAYEPLWAIGTGKTATTEQAQEMAAYIRSVISEKYGKDVADRVIIQYGGSVKPDNIRELMEQEDIDGALVGGASLDPEEFIKIIKYDPDIVCKNVKMIPINRNK